MMFKTKILILGPCGSGKTTIANYLADATEITGGDYRPTQGVRIVEFESNDLELNGKNIDAEVELWDCSGDRKFEKCWPAIQKDTHGVILVLNPNTASHLKEIEQCLHWAYTKAQKLCANPVRCTSLVLTLLQQLCGPPMGRYISFVARRAIKPNHVIVFGHRKPDTDALTTNATADQHPATADQQHALTRLLPPMMSGLQCVATNIEDDGENLRLEFNNFLCGVISGLTAGASTPTPPPQPAGGTYAGDRGGVSHNGGEEHQGDSGRDEDDEDD